MATELKPCPFCGSKPITRISFRTSPGGATKASVDVHIRCPECHCIRSVVLVLCDTDFEKAQSAMEKAIYAWNRRIEARPVVHGEWSAIEDDYCGLIALQCSECKQEYWFEEEPPIKIYNFCPNCGAKMDGGVSDGN